MTTFVWIVASGILMSAIALVGSLTLLLKESALRKIIASGRAVGGIASGWGLLPYDSGCCRRRELSNRALCVGLWVSVHSGLCGDHFTSLCA